MSRRYLFGPVSGDFATQNLFGQRQASACLAFDPAGQTDLAIAATDSWEAVRQRFPAGWEADFIVLFLPYTQIPECLWSAPIPIIGLAADWNLLWHWYRSCLPSCDLVLTDTLGVEAMTRAGMTHVRPAILYGCERGYVEEPWPEIERNIDILFVGNLHPAVQRERLAWLGRLARLGGRWRVEIHTGTFGAAYRELLGRSRIVFNRAIRGEANKRAFEAVAAGALLFQEADNRELPALLRDGQECVYYSDTNLEELLHR
jgi:hypothetical protein